MAKEVDIKKIELKVSVNCCDGCKRKVKKILQSVEGVLNTEIDPMQPQVTVIGNVDPQILIKRLSKAGKQAEICSYGNPNAGKEMKAAETPDTKAKDKSKSECEQAKKPSDSSCGSTNATEKRKETKSIGDGNDNNDSKKDQKEMSSNVNSSNPEVVKSENPLPSHPEGTTYNQCCYKVHPYAFAVPHYAIPSYMVSHPPPTCYGLEHLHYEMPVFQQAFQAPVVRVGDYFSDENTVGCQVM